MYEVESDRAVVSQKSQVTPALPITCTIYLGDAIGRRNVKFEIEFQAEFHFWRVRIALAVLKIHIPFL